VTLQIIGAGFGRTGTMSLYSALEQLGYPCYHMTEVLDNPANKSHMDFWLKVANDPAGSPQDWETVFANYTAAVDNPACCVWRELVAAYPEAKVILTRHPKGAEAWYRSTLDTIYFTESLWHFRVLSTLLPFSRKMKEMSSKLVWQRSLKNTMSSPDAAMARYEEHIQEVIRSLPEQKLLVFSVDQGWQPLCDFLGVPVPDTEFPSINDRADFQKRIRLVKVAASLILGAVVVSLVALGYLLA
jgi:Sulfotransferase domain